MPWIWGESFGNTRPVGNNVALRARHAQLTSFCLCSTDFGMSPIALTDRVPVPSRRAHTVARGICRLFARNDIWCLGEMPLRNGRRADLMGVDPKGRIVIVEIKTAR